MAVEAVRRGVQRAVLEPVDRDVAGEARVLDLRRARASRRCACLLGPERRRVAARPARHRAVFRRVDMRLRGDLRASPGSAVFAHVTFLPRVIDAVLRGLDPVRARHPRAPARAPSLSSIIDRFQPVAEQGPRDADAVVDRELGAMRRADDRGRRCRRQEPVGRPVERHADMRARIDVDIAPRSPWRTANRPVKPPGGGGEAARAAVGDLLHRGRGARHAASAVSSPSAQLADVLPVLRRHRHHRQAGHGGPGRCPSSAGSALIAASVTGSRHRPQRLHVDARPSRPSSAVGSG